MTTSISDNSAFRQACLNADLASFKQNPVITQIFEHVSIPFGEEYAQLIREEYPVLATLAPDFQLNDRVGGSIDRVDLNGVPLAPTTLRYVKVAGDLLDMGLDAAESIVEIGAGYGGQCLILDTINPRQKPFYGIYDLPEVASLQARYLDAHSIDHAIWFNRQSAVNQWDFCISNYAFSECTREMQDWYLENVILRSDHGYMVCNFISWHLGQKSYSVQELLNRIPGSRAIADRPFTAYQTVIVAW